MDRHRLMPSDTPDFMAPAWFDCLRWSLANDDILDAFICSPGFDPAEDSEDVVGPKYITWFNEKVWGPMGGTALRNAHTAGGVTPDL